ncbi:unnamed protein product [Ceratitis capitata]|uniref:(Mediterranean fruit fly) hypothetical protein n=1 Tax=Ceratitis capitata TaxID=7213 RepID=A0A811V8N8_CERCA|nr:unnamed protein product [Ceratitis capitata]
MKRNICASDSRKYERGRTRYHSSSGSDDNYPNERRISNIFPDYRHTSYDKYLNATGKHDSRSKMTDSGRKEFGERPPTPSPPIISSSKECIDTLVTLHHRPYAFQMMKKMRDL